MNPEKLFFDEEGFADHKVDCENKIIAPGFIDVQINGKLHVQYTLPLLHSPVSVKITVVLVVTDILLCQAPPLFSLIGGYGIDFSQATSDIRGGVAVVAKKILEQGVTSFCPTLVTSPPDIYHKVQPMHQ